MRDNLVTTFYGWGEEYIVSFDFEASQAMSSSTVTNILHLSIGGQYGNHGDRIPAVFANQLSSSEQVIEFRSSVSGNHDHGFDFSYELNTQYHIEISQLKNGDIVNLDVTIYKDGVHADLNESFLIGDVDDDHVKLVKNSYDCLQVAANMVRPRTMYRDLGTAIHKKAVSCGFQVVKTYCGHGIGTEFHEEPQIVHYKNNDKTKMEEGMCFTIEPMINLGTHRINHLSDGWTILTQDGKPSAHFEHDIAIVDGKPELLSTFKYIYDALGIVSDEELEFNSSTL